MHRVWVGMDVSKDFFYTASIDSEGNIHADQSAQRRMKMSSIARSSFILSLDYMMLIKYSKQEGGI